MSRALSDIGNLAREQMAEAAGIGQAMSDAYRQGTQDIDLLAVGPETQQQAAKVAQLFGRLAGEKFKLELERKRITTDATTQAAADVLAPTAAAGAGAGRSLGMEPGRLGFRELGRSLQDALLERDTPQKTIAKESVKQTKLLEDIKNKDTAPAAMELT
jgi:hypothetical protein